MGKHGIEKDILNEEFCFRTQNLFLTSGNSQNFCCVLPISYIGGFPVNNFAQCDFPSVLIDSEPGTWITSYTVTVFGVGKIFRIKLNKRPSYLSGTNYFSYMDSICYSGLLHTHFVNYTCHFRKFFFRLC